MVKEAVTSIFGRKQATLARHVADILTPLTLLGAIVPTTVMYAEPAKAELIAKCSPALKAANGACAASIAAALPIHQALVVLNVLMFTYDVRRSRRLESRVLHPMCTL